MIEKLPKLVPKIQEIETVANNRNKINELTDVVNALVRLIHAETGARERSQEEVYKELRSDPVVRKIWELEDD